MKMTGKLKLSQTDTRQLRLSIMQQWLAALNATLQGRVGAMVEHVRQALLEALLQAPEWSTIANDYRGEFGIVNPSEVITAICQRAADSVQVRLTPFRYAGSTIGGSLTLTAIPANYADLLAMPEAVILSENNKVFSWLYALLFQGDEIVIAEYKYLSEVLTDEDRAKYSRTGLGFMVPMQGKGWRVPPEISGTRENNLITRALTSPAIQQVIESELTGLLA
jgi:hypothetical protein